MLPGGVLLGGRGENRLRAGDVCNKGGNDNLSH